jgi:hypothetical protein
MSQTEGEKLALQTAKGDRIRIGLEAQATVLDAGSPKGRSVLDIGSGDGTSCCGPIKLST